MPSARRCGREDLARISASYGLDQPLHIQFVKWAAGMLTGDWGRSYRDSRPVRDVILDRMPATLELTATALAIAVIARCRHRHPRRAAAVLRWPTTWRRSAP